MNYQKNPFSYSLIIQAQQLDDYSLITQFLDEPAYTQLIEDKDLTDLESHEQAIARVSNISNRIKQIGLGITLILIFNSVLVVLNAIRLNIYTHREEIVIMKLVGASNWMVRGPFFVESILYAVFSIILAMAVIYPIIEFIQPFLPNLLGQPEFNILTYYLANWASFIGWQLLGVIVLTVFASMLAIRRYLRV